MKDADRPVLAPDLDAHIEAAQISIDLNFWAILRQFQILDPKSERILRLNNPNSPPGPLRPSALRLTIIAYARNLYVAEGNYYQDDPQLEMWLKELAIRTIERVMQTVAQLEDDSRERHVSLMHHGLTQEQMRKCALEELASLIRSRLMPTQDRPPLAPNVHRQMVAEPAQEVASNPSNRRSLFDSYRAAFPDVKIADICWAAAQTRREWKRWINGESKDGLKPDRSFRRILESGKKPEETVGKPRPIKYS
ncbi:MAG TPA: hypothetical protein VME23_18305 [Terracidiphilus sp.]|nr:hypothetical protein [Terracidiphilus sp.]